MPEELNSCFAALVSWYAYQGSHHQLIVFNSVARPRHHPEATGSTHHIRSRECPLPIHTVLKIHGATRDRALSDAFYNLGLSVLYGRFLTVLTEITNTVIDR